MEKLLFKIIHKFPRFFSIFGIRDVKPDLPDMRDDVMGAEPRFEWKQLKKSTEDWEEDFENTHLEVQTHMDCTGHGLKAILQVLYWVKWKEKIKISAAYINGMANTSKWRGNSMKTILESVRKYGWVTDEEWPEENRWRVIPQSVIDKGRAKLKEFHFGYDKVSPDKKSMDFGILFSPLYGGGYGWGLRGLLYYSWGKANHCFILLANLIIRLAGDSYEPHIKRLAPSYKFVWPRRIYLEKKVLEYKSEDIKKLIEKGKEYLVRPDADGQWYLIKPDGLKYVPNINEIADIIAKELKKSPQNVNEMIRFLTQIGKVKWANEKEYYNLIK